MRNVELCNKVGDSCCKSVDYTFNLKWEFISILGVCHFLPSRSTLKSLPLLFKVLLIRHQRSFFPHFHINRCEAVLTLCCCTLPVRWLKKSYSTFHSQIFLVVKKKELWGTNPSKGFQWSAILIGASHLHRCCESILITCRK